MEAIWVAAEMRAGGAFAHSVIALDLLEVGAHDSRAVTARASTPRRPASCTSWTRPGPGSAPSPETPRAGCAFCQIASGARAAQVVAEDADIVAFAEPAPIREGHLKIIPKAHYGAFEELPAELAARILVPRAAAGAGAEGALRGGAGRLRLSAGRPGAMRTPKLIPLHERSDLTSRRCIVESELTFVRRPPATEEALARVAAALREAVRRG